MIRLAIILSLFYSFAFSQPDQFRESLQPAQSAEELDSLWESFIENQNSESFIRIFKSLIYHSERKDINKFLVGSASKYSLIGNGKTNAYIFECIKSVTNVSRGFLKEEGLRVLQLIDDPDGINNYRDEVSRILSEIAENNHED